MSAVTPTLIPSPQGGGMRRAKLSEQTEASILSSPSPLWGGIKGGRISPHTGRPA